MNVQTLSTIEHKVVQKFNAACFGDFGAGPLLEFIASQTEVQTAVGKHIAVFGGNEDDEEDTRYTRQKIASFALQCGSDRQEVRVIVSVAAVVVVVATATRIEVFAFLDFIKAFYW